MGSAADVVHLDLRPRVRALAQHRRTLELRVERLARLLRTVDRTIARLTEEDTMPLTDEERYEGFSPKDSTDRAGPLSTPLLLQEGVKIRSEEIME